MFMSRDKRKFYQRGVGRDKNADISIFISIFLEKERKDTSLQISLAVTITYKKANTFRKILKLHGKWYHENHFRYVSNTVEPR